MILSYLFTPADQPGKVAKALACDTDAVILDLEDAVDPARRPAAREIAANAIGGRCNVWVRINPLGGEDADLDLQAVIPAAPAGIVLPKPEGVADAVELARRLDRLEAAAGLEPGRIGILPLCTERPGALFALGAYRDSTPRLAGLSWGAEDLSSALGAAANRDADGEWLPPYQLARSLCLFAAAAAGVPAVDTVFTNFRDAAGLARAASAARRDGFGGMLAIHPAQIAVIHKAFTPTTAEIDRAQQIVERFADQPESGTVGLDGVMLDRPHLVQAQRTLELAERARGR
jgi:citrate lyase subunit beta / citryl-CoA lyase